MADSSGLIQPGNIDLNNRPVVRNPDGSISTVRSVSVNIDGREVLLPTVTDDGREVSPQEAVAIYRQTGKHLGIFDNAQHATAYAEQLHQQQATRYAPQGRNMANGYDPNNPLNPNIADPPGGRPIPQGSPDDTGQVGAGPRALVAAATGGLSNLMIPGGSKKGSTSGKGVGAGKSYDPDEMINTYLPGLTPDQRSAVRDALKGAEGGSGVDYHKAIDQLVTQHPELQTHTKWGKAFGSQTPGQLTPEVLKALTAFTQNYQKPYLDEMSTISQSVGESLKKLLPSMPESYKGLIQAEIPVYQNLGKGVADAIRAADPGLIANAYGQAYSAPTTSATAANPISSLLTQLGQSPQPTK